MKQQGRFFLTSLILGLVLGLNSHPSEAQSNDSKEESVETVEKAPALQWNYKIMPYLWQNELIDSKVTFRNPVFSSANLSVTNLNESSQINYGMRLDANRGKWGYFVDITSSPNLFMYQGAGTYRLFANDKSHLDGFFGARAYSNDFELQVQSPAGGLNLPNSGRIDENLGFVDLIVGAKGEIGLSENLSFYGLADVGGLNILDSSDFTYQIDAGFKWNASDSTSIQLGWRQLRFDNEDESDLRVVKYEATYGGPTLGVQIRI